MNENGIYKKGLNKLYPQDEVLKKVLARIKAKLEQQSSVKLISQQILYKNLLEKKQ